MDERQQVFLKFLSWLLFSFFFTLLLSCKGSFELGELVFDAAYVEELSSQQRYSLFESALRDSSLDPLLLSSQILFYLEDSKNLAASDYLRLLLAQRLLDESIETPTRFILEDLLQKETKLEDTSLHSIRRETLKSLIKISYSPYKKSIWIDELVNNYDLSVDERAYWFYELGRNLEYIQRWDEAISAYRVFASYPNISIADAGDAYLTVRSKLSIYDRKKNWRVEDDLNVLVREIRDVVHRRQTNRIQSYMANDFFAISGNFTNDLLRRGSINLPIFMSSQVRFGDFTPESNEKEAWLKTYNWPLSISLWYLYFRRIDYPADPSIDGRWEWAGIFIGELL